MSVPVSIAEIFYLHLDDTQREQRSKSHAISRTQVASGGFQVPAGSHTAKLECVCECEYVLRECA